MERSGIVCYIWKSSKKNLTFAINFVATPFLGGSIFFLMLHKQKFAINFLATPVLGGSFFSYATQAKVCINFVATPFLGGSFFFLCYTSKNLQ